MLIVPYRCVVPRKLGYGILSLMKLEVNSADAMKALGAQIGALTRGGEVIELVGDIGAGKTTFTKGLAHALGVDEDVQSPTFTISRVYDATEGRRLAHYDFYRLGDAGVLRAELAESVSDPSTITVIEWAEIVEDVLPAATLRLEIIPSADDARMVTIESGGEFGDRLQRELA